MSSFPHYSGEEPCASAGVDTMFPTRKGSAAERLSRAVCTGDVEPGDIACPMLERCRDYAMSALELYGTWGGLSEWDRERLRKLDPRLSRVLTMVEGR